MSAAEAVWHFGKTLCEACRRKADAPSDGSRNTRRPSHFFCQPIPKVASRRAPGSHFRTPCVYGSQTGSSRIYQGANSILPLVRGVLNFHSQVKRKRAYLCCSNRGLFRKASFPLRPPWGFLVHGFRKRRECGSCKGTVKSEAGDLSEPVVRRKSHKLMTH